MLLTDARWAGPHGIGRFANEVLTRLPLHSQITAGPRPLSALDSFWLSLEIARRRPSVFFSPGFNPPVHCRVPMIFTIHDLIHLSIPEEGGILKRQYFERIVRPAARRAFRVVTVSEYSRAEILAWTGLAPHRVIVAGNGVDSSFCAYGPRTRIGARYVLYVGNRKPHKNLDRMFEAFHGVADTSVKLMLTGEPDRHVMARARRGGISSRIVFSGTVPDAEMPSLYRGAEVLILPSLLEGFGLPVIEAMASATPVIAARTSSLPEVAGNAALMIDPLNVRNIRDALNAVLGSASLRSELRELGLMRAVDFTWERAVAPIKEVLLATGWGDPRAATLSTRCRCPLLTQ